ncbi:uncharacterized protein LOC108163975 [Drosophila miranda]|uniref:uncharacterized protein LOC108163975 n=1 Tax=Drosophila miranda TaxID=7229 RepID=UPI00143F6AB1|nr:uncharacterized protein LOC108163975 [Drosophila miranda]
MTEIGWIIFAHVMFITCVQINNAGQSEPHYRWTTLDWLEAHNVSHELHNVTTADGYQLQLQRLPRPGARTVLLVHGLLGSSLGWVCLGPDKSLGGRVCPCAWVSN